MAKELEIRKCVLSGKVLDKDELLRFVVLDDGRMLPDFNKQIDGRGFYISNSKTLLDSLTAKNPLGKVLHKKVDVPADLSQTVENVLCKKGIDAINLARKAGGLVLGFEKVKDTISKGKAAFVIEAVDAGADGKQKIAAMAKNLEKFTLYDTETLDKALGRENTVYLVVKKCEIAKMVKTALKRYQTFLNT
jgi:hypothetical protein